VRDLAVFRAVSFGQRQRLGYIGGRSYDYERFISCHLKASGATGKKRTEKESSDNSSRLLKKSAEKLLVFVCFA
jgi:hypothetical protein